MSIRTSFLLMATALVVLLASLLYVLLRVVDIQQDLTESETRHYESYKLADELRQSSDDLTRMARTYVVTGDPRYERWFRRILAIRNGEEPRPLDYTGGYWDAVTAAGEESAPMGETVSLETLMRRMQFSKAELAMLRRAQANSDALVGLEDRAMAAIKGLYPDASGRYRVHGEPDPELARALLHGEAYHRAKGEIMRPIEEFLAMVEARTTRELEDLRAQNRRLTRSAVGLMLAATAVVALAIGALQRRVMRPVTALAEAAHRVEEGDYSARLRVRHRDEIGRLTGAFNLMSQSIERDMAERERAAAELAEAREAAEAANRAKSAFLANMSHELRTPMNAVIGYSEMLAEEMAGAGDDEYVPDVEKIQAAGRHLLGLINDVLDLSKIEAGRMDLYLERFDLREMLAEATSTVAPLVEQNGNRLETKLEGELGSMRADLTKVRQSLFNLLSNAAKFTRDGVVTLAARRVREDGRDRIVLSVSDTGIGIAPDKLEQVFEEFSQADESTSRNFGGTGLGLAISRRFCRMMGGDISVSSRLGEGSTFRIELPVEVDALEVAKAAAAEEAREEEAGGRTVGSARRGGGPALVIDDDEEARDLLRRTLEADGLEVRTAAGGEEGLALAREIHPAVITLDVMMPGMDGWEVLRRLKADPELRLIPVVMVSILHEKGLGFSLGAAEYLTKPIDRKLLLHLVARYAGARAEPLALVVEDDAAARDLVRRVLEGAGWRVQEAENGAVGLERAAEHAPDLVVLDLMMPVLDGFGFLRELRRREEGRDVPVLVLTAKEIEPEERRMLSEQTQVVLRKDADSLEAAVQRVRASVHAYTGEGG